MRSPIVVVFVAAINIPKYTKNDLQQIKTILEAWALAPASAPIPALATSEEPQDKPLKVRFPDIYCNNSHIDYYNFCQQCEDYFAITGATELNQILFTTVFL